MINKYMNNNEDKKVEVSEKPESKPNETGGVYFSSHLKISDPNTKEILVQMRGDN
jgi:hypothetical protein